MGRKNTKTIQKEAAKTLASSFTTDWLNVSYLDNVGVVINCNNVTDNTGFFEVQVRMKVDANNVSSAVTLTLSSVPTLANADDDFGINLNQLPYNEVRISFTAAGGTPDGDCDIWFKSETVGA